MVQIRLRDVQDALGKNLPELILDRTHPDFPYREQGEARFVHALHKVITDTTGKLNIAKVAKEFFVPVDALRDALKEYKAQNRVLNHQQEAVLCGRLDRLTRFGGQCKASEEPARVEDLIEKYAVGTLQLFERGGLGVTYTLTPQWVGEFLTRHPQYNVTENGPPAASGSKRAETHALDHWLLDNQKMALCRILEKDLPLRTSKGLEAFWKHVKHDAAKEIGYGFDWLNSRNEVLQRKHRQKCPEGLQHTVLGKRKREGQAEGVTWQIWDAACHDFLSTDLAIHGNVDPPPFSPPPTLDPADAVDVLPQSSVPHKCSSLNPPNNAIAPHHDKSRSRFRPTTTQTSDDLSTYMGNNLVFVGEPWIETPSTYLPCIDDHQEETLEIRKWNALGVLAQSTHPNAASASRAYRLADRPLREAWAKRKNRHIAATSRLTTDQERRLCKRLDRLLYFGGSVRSVETVPPDGNLRAIVQTYANGILAEDDQLVEGNMVLHGHWAEEFTERFPQYARLYSNLG
ncbi:hypothetical protein B0A50_01697 [Salinomyces thailandicus]|uniref:Uncharacterized protein n=1 Tax=Salinomyces thailandicus TaxID=706561 RepID=A0A4U0U8K7_9PEZI|nr:hypothetical protein B0A50_01697 [Salinomyces thailandica]